MYSLSLSYLQPTKYQPTVVLLVQGTSWNTSTVSMVLYTTRSTSTRSTFASLSSTRMWSWRSRPVADWYWIYITRHWIPPAIWLSAIQHHTEEATG